MARVGKHFSSWGEQQHWWSCNIAFLYRHHRETVANFIEIGFALVTHTQKRGENEQFFFKEENILGNGITQASYAMGPGCNCKRILTGQCGGVWRRPMLWISLEAHQNISARILTRCFLKKKSSKHFCGENTSQLLFWNIPVTLGIFSFGCYFSL